MGSVRFDVGALVSIAKFKYLEEINVKKINLYFKEISWKSVAVASGKLEQRKRGSM